MWFKQSVFDEVDEVARVGYLDREFCASWNKNRRDNELRLLTGWYWVELGGSRRQNQGLKTKSVAYRDAWYALVQRAAAPAVIGPRPVRIRRAA